MTKDDIKVLADALNNKSGKNETEQAIKRIFRKKKCSTIIHELKDLMVQMSQKEQKVSLLIVVISILYKNGGLIDSVKISLEDEGLIQHLYGALRIYLGGRSSIMHLEVEWSDDGFKNKFEFLRRFISDFGYWENREVLYAAKIVALADRARFEELAFKDKTYLIILNMLSYQLGESPTDELIIRLLKDGDELQANIGFYFAIRDLMRDVQDYQLYERNSRLPQGKSKREINKNIKEHFETFYLFYSQCSIERRVSLLLNYILSEKIYFKKLGYLLMEFEHQEVLVQEINSSGKIKNLDDLANVVCLIRNFSCKDVNEKCHDKIVLYEAIFVVWKKFIINRTGIYYWDDIKETSFKKICNNFPRKYLRKMSSFLKNNMKKYMVSELDELVRFNIYLDDKKQWDICQGMINILKDVGIE